MLQGEADQQLNALMNQNSVDSRTGWVLRRQNDDENLSIVPPIDATLVPAATSKQATFPGVWDTKFKELIQGLQKQFSDLRIQRRGNGYSLKVNRKVVAKLMPLNDSPPTFEVAFSSSISDAKASANALGPQAIEKTISNQPLPFCRAAAGRGDLQMRWRRSRPVPGNRGPGTARLRQRPVCYFDKRILDFLFPPKRRAGNRNFKGYSGGMGKVPKRLQDVNHAS